MEHIKSRYQFEEIPNGFRITSLVNQFQVDISPNPDKTCFRIYREGTTSIFNPDGSNKIERDYLDYGLFSIHEIINDVARQFRKKADPKLDEKYPSEKTPPKFIGRKAAISKWATKKTATALAKKIATRLRELRSQLNPFIVQTQKLIFGLIGPNKYKECWLIKEAKFYKENELWCKDLVNYPGAIVWLYEEEENKRLGTKLEKSQDWMKLYLTKELPKNNYKSRSRFNFDEIDLQAQRIDEIAEKGDSVVLRPYKALTKTLMARHTLRSFILLKRFGPTFHLLRPYTQRTELRILTNFIDHRNWQLHKEVILKSDLTQFKKVFKDVARQIHEKPDLRKSKFIRSVVSFIMDYGETHNGEITGLAEKSIEWHRNIQEENIKKQIKDKAEPTKNPPIELPSEPGVRFLKTAGEVHQEALDMNHCISGYFRGAAIGNCYLFSIEYNGHRASAEVSKEGYIKQIRGPSNNPNPACDWGTKQLNKWCEKLKQYIKEKGLDKFNIIPYTTQVRQNVLEYEEVPF